MPTSTADSPTSPSTPSLSWLVWNESLKAWDSLSATEIIHRFETGFLTADTLLKVSKDAQAKPFRKHIRELVWLSHQQNTLSHSRSISFEMVNHAPIPTALSDLAGRITHVNQAFCDFIEYPALQLIGMNVGALSHKHDHQKETEHGNQLLSGTLDGFQMSKRYITQSGKVKEGLLGIVILKDDQGVPESVMAQIIDLTPFQIMQEQMSTHKALAAIGRMAQEITHDLKNILMALQGTLALIKTYPFSNESEEQTLIEEGLLICKNGYRLIQNLITFDPSCPYSQEQIDLSQWLPQQAKSLQLHLNPCPLSLSIPQQEIWVIGDDQRFESLLFNLCVNAKKAIQSQIDLDHPHKTLKEKQSAFQDHLIQVKVEICDEGYIKLLIEDTGCGMSSTLLKKIMKPYFSTHSQSGGTGLGLASVWRTCEHFQIETQITSTPHKGTCFELKFTQHIDSLT